MALPSTLHHFDVRLSQVDRGVDRDLALKVARHPSETIERLWLRILACCWQWEETIAFGPGICEPDEPDLLALGPDGSTRTLLVRVGRPEVARVEKDCARGGGARVAVLFESPRRLEAFLAEARAGRPERLARAELAAVPEELLRALSAREDRRIKLGLTIADDHLYVDLGGESLDGPLVRRTP
ncbi:MAG TPA: YaeQ family protein [Anaeromyxobacteraceae bacterium]|nr:YaeQ family protein [Anaeromyxobacteraceae bacterium]